MRATFLSISLFVAGSLFICAFPQNSSQSAGQDMKDAGNDAKHAAVKTGHAAKKGATKSTHAVKKGAHKVAAESEKGAQNVKEKTADTNPK